MKILPIALQHARHLLIGARLHFLDLVHGAFQRVEEIRLVGGRVANVKLDV